MQLLEPLPGQDVDKPPTEEELEAEGQLFMAAMAQHAARTKG